MSFSIDSIKEPRELPLKTPGRRVAHGLPACVWWGSAALDPTGTWGPKLGSADSSKAI